MNRSSLSVLVAAAFVAASFTGAPACAGGAQAASTQVPPSETWPGLVTDVFGGRPMQTDERVIALEAPYRAEDAAIVPVDIRTDPAAIPGDRVKAITLIIDENPAPVAAVFRLGEDAGITHLATRVRVNAYTHVHAVAETEGGKLYVADRFVKASGGCSAPAVKNPDEALASMGKMKLRRFEASADGRPELQLMIRHPNNSGLQMDQLTRNYIPAHFVQNLSIWEGDRLLLAMEGGISISEDPNFRFDYRPNGAGTIRVEAKDTEGLTFRDEWRLESKGT